MNNADAVSLACYEAGGALNRIDIEHIALAAYEIAPVQFCWKHFPERIDLRTVQYALKNEVLSTAPRLTGSVKDGYQLTPVGLEWAHGSVSAVGNDVADDRQGVTPKIEAERRRLRSTSAFRKHVAGGDAAITRQDFDAFVRINDYFPDALRTERIAKITNIVAGDSELEGVWRTLKTRFGDEDYER